MNNSGQPAREEWIRAGVYVRLQKNLVPVCYLVGMRRRCCRAANYEANQQSHTSFHRASLFWGNDTPFRQAKTGGRNTIQNRLKLLDLERSESAVRQTGIDSGARNCSSLRDCVRIKHAIRTRDWFPNLRCNGRLPTICQSERICLRRWLANLEPTAA